MESALYIVPALIIVVVFLSTAIKVLREFERAVIFRLGRLIAAKGPGLVLLIPLVDKMVKVSLRTLAMEVPPQDVITRDNVSVKVSAVVFFRVLDPRNAVVQVQDFLFATSQIAQTTLRSVLGQVELDDLLASRDKINQQLQRIIDEHTGPWGVKVTTVEVKQVTCRRTCNGRCRSKPRPSGSGGRRSSTPRENTRRRKSSRRPPEFWPAPRSPSSSGFCRRCGRWPRNGTRPRSSPCPSISLSPS